MVLKTSWTAAYTEARARYNCRSVIVVVMVRNGIMPRKIFPIVNFDGLAKGFNSQKPNMMPILWIKHDINFCVVEIQSEANFLVCTKTFGFQEEKIV